LGHGITLLGAAESNAGALAEFIASGAKDDGLPVPDAEQQALVARHG
jgi:hypothetical protein